MNGLNVKDKKKKIPISDLMLKEKALEIEKSLGMEDLGGNNG